MSPFSMQRNGYKLTPSGKWVKMAVFPNNVIRLVRNRHGKLVKTEGIYKSKSKVITE